MDLPSGCRSGPDLHRKIKGNWTGAPSFAKAYVGHPSCSRQIRGGGINSLPNQKRLHDNVIRRSSGREEREQGSRISRAHHRNIP